jgi:hypothetical protein
MLLDEFVDFRVRAGETERQGAEREQARRVREHGRWLESLLPGRRTAKEGATPAAAEVAVPAGAEGVVPADAPAALTPAGGAAGGRERELAHVGR